MRNLECVIAIATVEWHTVSFLRACFIRGSFVCGNQLGLASSRWGFGPEARNFFLASNQGRGSTLGVSGLGAWPSIRK